MKTFILISLVWFTILKVQKSLKLKVEAQRRFLDRIVEELRNRTTITKPGKPPSPPAISLPSLCDESSDSNIAKEFESDSEADKTEIQFGEGFIRAPKRLRHVVEEEDDLSPTQNNIATVDFESYFQGMFLSKEQQKISNPADNDINFSWNLTASAGPSPIEYWSG